MSNKLHDDFIDDIPEIIDYSDEADAAFWDEFMLLESSPPEEEESFTISIENDFTGEKRVFKNIKLKKNALGD